MGRNWVEPTMFSALLVAPASEQGGSSTRLSDLATGLRARGHRVRLVTTSDVGGEASRAWNIPRWLLRHAAEHQASPGELAGCARAILLALSAEPTHIIHTASLRGSYAAALATFAYTLRHPCAPEPAIVTTLDEDHGPAQTRRLLPGDYFIVSSEQARDALVGGGGHRRLSERTHVIAPGRDHDAAAILAVYHLAWERRQRENRQALLAFEA